MFIIPRKYEIQNWKHLSKQNCEGIFKSSNMELKKTRGAVYRQRYLEKVKEINERNARFMAFCKKEAPWLVEQFFEMIR